MGQPLDRKPLDKSAAVKCCASCRRISFLLEPFHEQFLEAIRTGRRKQEPLIPNEYRYYKQFDGLLPENNHLIASVVFKTQLDETGNYVPNNFVVTGWANYLEPKR